VGVPFGNILKIGGGDPFRKDLGDPNRKKDKFEGGA